MGQQVRTLSIIGLFSITHVMTYISVKIFGIVLAPIPLAIVSVVLPIWLIRTSLAGCDTDGTEGHTSTTHHWLPLVTIGGLLLLIPALATSFFSNPLPTPHSDVITQLEHLWDRWVSGQQPYTTVESYSWKPFPVYMPMHWWPIGIGKALGIDLRWGGVIIYAAAALAGATALMRNRILDMSTAAFYPAAVILLVAIPLVLRDGEISNVFEIVVAGYYLLLGLGLYLKNDKVIILALICVMLSRYTLVFYLPVLGMTLYWTFGVRKVVAYASIGSIAFVLLYIIPFWMREPSILSDGINYHNLVAERWYTDMVDGRPNYILTEGSSSMLLAYTITGITDGVQGTALIRWIQILVNLVAICTLLYLYRKQQAVVNMYDFLLGSAALFLAIFYCTAPFAYGYYWMSYHVLVWFIVIRLINIQSTKQKSNA